MSVIPVLHRESQVRGLVRRGVRGTGARVLACRSWERLGNLVAGSLIDAVVVDVRREDVRRVAEWVKLFPGVPIFGFSALRPDDGALVLSYLAAGAADVLVGNVDDAVLGEIVADATVVGSVRRDLKDAAHLLRLSEPIQQRVWREVLDGVDQEVRTATIAGRLGMSREHLSREFAAGGAPNLKRVIDLAKLVVAARMLSNPGYPTPTVARILCYATPGHLATCAERIAGVKPVDLPELGPRGILNRFRRGRTRSRL